MNNFEYEAENLIIDYEGGNYSDLLKGLVKLNLDEKISMLKNLESWARKVKLNDEDFGNYWTAVSVGHITNELKRLEELNK